MAIKITTAQYVNADGIDETQEQATSDEASDPYCCPGQQEKADEAFERWGEFCEDACEVRWQDTEIQHGKEKALRVA